MFNIRVRHVTIKFVNIFYNQNCCLVRSDARIISSDPVKAMWGENVIITCMATGYPIPQIKWSFQEQKRIPVKAEVKENTSIESSIEIVDVNASKHGGTYFCKANNILGTSEVNVTVNGKHQHAPVTLFYKLLFIANVSILRSCSPC